MAFYCLKGVVKKKGDGHFRCTDSKRTRVLNRKRAGLD